MRKLLVVLLVLGLAGVGADRVAHKVATDEAEQRLAAEGLDRPTVAVDGFPFLTQLLSRRFDEVRVTASSWRTGTGRAEDISATGLDVRAPGDGEQVQVARLSARGVIPYAAVLRRVGQPGLSLGSGADGQVRLRRDVTLQGRTVAVTARGRVQATGTRIRLQPTGFRLEGGDALAGGLAALLADRFAVEFRVPGLPDGVRIERVTAADDGFVVDVTGEQLELSSISVGQAATPRS